MARIHYTLEYREQIVALDCRDVEFRTPQVN